MKFGCARISTHDQNLGLQLGALTQAGCEKIFDDKISGSRGERPGRAKAIDTGTPSGRFFFHVMASLSDMERELTVERARAGLEVARQPGLKGGRKRQMTASKIESARKLLANGISPHDVVRNLGVSVPTLYRGIPAAGAEKETA